MNSLTFYSKSVYASPRMSTKEEERRIELLQGTLDLLILRTLLLGRAHGHAIAKAIETNSEDVLQVEQGSLYPALHRLIKRRWIAAEEGTSENNRRAKYCRLTPQGRKQLIIETTRWNKLARAIARILRPASEQAHP
jgi:PadR family transcriptional regulator PadR